MISDGAEVNSLKFVEWYLQGKAPSDDKTLTFLKSMSMDICWCITLTLYTRFLNWNTFFKNQISYWQNPVP